MADLCQPLQSIASTGLITLRQYVTDISRLTIPLLPPPPTPSKHRRTFTDDLGDCLLVNKMKKKSDVTHQRRVIRKSGEPSSVRAFSSGLTDYQLSELALAASTVELPQRLVGREEFAHRAVIGRTASAACERNAPTFNLWTQWVNMSVCIATRVITLIKKKKKKKIMININSEKKK